MKVLGLNGREYHLDTKKYLSNPRAKISRYHDSARDLINEVYNGHAVLEEVKLPGSTNSSKKSVLFLDFLIPHVKMGVEVHGRQHYEYVPYFHKSKAGYFQAKARDAAKIEWCDTNNIELIVLKYNEPEHWRDQIEGRR
jgi:hypothetical protein